MGDGPLGDSATAGEPFRSAAAATADQPSIASGEKSCLELELKRLDDHGDDDHGDDDDKKRRERRTMVAAKRATNDDGGGEESDERWWRSLLFKKCMQSSMVGLQCLISRQQCLCSLPRI